jgi:two-component system response regulator HydG
MQKKPLIMIIDDDENQRKTLSLVLSHEGFSVLTAGSGEEGIHLASENADIDLVLLDIIMPVMNGIDTFRSLKTVIPNAIVIMMTAYAVEDMVKEALREGVYSIVYKPVEIENLVAMIETAVSSQNSALVLVVDDDPNTLSVFKKSLLQRGFRVLTAGNGEDAIELSAKHDFDIMFIDMRLPTLNGLETFLRIKRSKQDAVAVMFSDDSHEYSTIRDRALSESAYACLQKPVDMGIVVRLVNDLMARKVKMDG